jgi:hypothetical protein
VVIQKSYKKILVDFASILALSKKNSILDGFVDIKIFGLLDYISIHSVLADMANLEIVILALMIVWLVLEEWNPEVILALKILALIFS